MRYKSLILSLLFLSILLVNLTSTSLAYKEKVIQARMYLTPEVKLKNLLPLQLDIIRLEPGEFFEFITNAQQIEDLRGKGYEVEIVHEDLVAFYRSQLDTTQDMGGYHTYEETGDFLDSMHNEYPAITTDTISIGYTWEDRSIWAFKISDNPETDEDEPEILYTGLHHAREPMSIEVLLYYIDYLLTNYGTDPEATDLVNSTEMWFVVILNPDGYEYNRANDPGGGGMWRKNRRDNGNGTFGVDPNRNYGYMWGYDDIGSSPSTGSETYRGPAPFSEPENQAIRDFVFDHDFITCINYHSVAEMFLLPWGYDYAQPSDFLVDEIFGDQGASDALMKGWATRSQSVFSGTMDALLEEIQYLEDYIKSLEEGTAPPPKPGTRRVEDGRRRRERRVPMREGGAGIVTGHEEAVGVRNGITRKTPGAQHHHLGLVISAAQGRGITLAKAIDLGGAEHRMALAAPDIVEDARETHPALVGLHEIIATLAQWIGFAEHVGLRVGHHQCRVKGLHCQAGCQPGNNTNAGGEHFAVIAKRLAGRYDA